MFLLISVFRCEKGVGSTDKTVEPTPTVRLVHERRHAGESLSAIYDDQIMASRLSVDEPIPGVAPPLSRLDADLEMEKLLLLAIVGDETNFVAPEHLVNHELRRGAVNDVEVLHVFPFL